MQTVHVPIAVNKKRTGNDPVRDFKGFVIYLNPPEATIIWPVSQPASSEARKVATRAISSGCPIRPSGVLEIIFFSISLPAMPAISVPSVAVIPGAIAFTRMFFGASSTAKALVRVSTAPFVAE